MTPSLVTFTEKVFFCLFKRPIAYNPINYDPQEGYFMATLQSITKAFQTNGRTVNGSNHKSHGSEDLTDIFGSNVFNDRTMKERLPKDTYRALKETIEKGA